jgi:hypothetical protein
MSSSSGPVTYRGIDLEIDYYSTPYMPAVYYLANGDPGYPAEGGDFDVEDVRLAGSDVSIIELLSDETIDRIAEAYCEQHRDDNEY